MDDHQQDPEQTPADARPPTAPEPWSARKSVAVSAVVLVVAAVVGGGVAYAADRADSNRGGRGGPGFMMPLPGGQQDGRQNGRPGPGHAGSSMK